jgi:muramoyltetrapeptide carboxypeptidase LdcA involved in peptidoglycan recycling
VKNLLGVRVKELNKKERKLVRVISPCSLCGEHTAFASTGSKALILDGYKVVCNKCDKKVLNDSKPKVIIELSE